MVVFSNFPPPTDGIKHMQPLTTVHINNQEIGKGNLFIAESRLSWVNDLTGQGFSLEYEHIAVHAVSRDLQAHPSECLYILVDRGLNQDNEHGDGDDSESGTEETEMMFTPDDKGMLDAMYHAMCECQSLHPDPQNSLSEDDEECYEDAEEEDEEEEGEYHLAGGDAAILGSNFEGTVNGNGVDNAEEPMEMDGQFEDADDY